MDINRVQSLPKSLTPIEKYHRLTEMVDQEDTLAILINADLTRANMLRCNLTQADMRGAYLGNARLKGAILVGAIYDSHTTWPADLTPSPAGAIIKEA